MDSEQEGMPRHGWRIALFLFLLTATNGFLQPFVPIYMSGSGLSATEIGLCLGIGTGLALLVQPILGKLSDHFDSRRPFICLGAVVAGAGYCLYPMARGFASFLVLTAIAANGTLYLNAAGGVLVGRMVRASRGGEAYARLRVWGSIGYILVSLLTGFLLTLHGAASLARADLDLLFRTGPLLFFGIAALSWWLPDARTQTAERATQTSGLSPNLRRFLFAFFLYSFALYGAFPYLSLYLKQLGAQPIGITLTFAGGVLAEVIVMSRIGILSDLYGRRPALMLAFMVLPIRMLLYVAAPGPGWVAATNLLHGLNFGIVGAVSIAFMNDLAEPGGHGRAQARLAAVLGLATAVGPAAFGALSQQLGMRGMFVCAALVGAAGAVSFALTVEESHPGSKPLSAACPRALRAVCRFLESRPLCAPGAD